MAQSSTKKKKSKESAKGKKPVFFPPMKDINEALKNCRRLMDDGVITLELRIPFRVVFRIDEEKFKNLEGWSDKKQSKFRKILSEEITIGMQSALSDLPFRRYIPFIDSDKDRKQADLIVEKTREVLVSNEIESLSRLKHSSKNKVLQSLQWEVNLKERDRQLGHLKDARYATICFWYTQPTSGIEDTFQGIFRIAGLFDSSSSDQSLTLDLHPYEIKSLIEDLSKIMKSLEG